MRGQGRGACAALVVVVVSMLMAEVYLVVGRSVGLPRVPRTAESFEVEGLARGHRVSQTFLLGAGGFDGVRLSTAVRGASHDGAIALELYEVPRDRDGVVIDGAQRLLFRDRVPVRTVIREPTFLFRFPAIDGSAGHFYRLDVWMPEPRNDDGVSLWATDGRWSEGGSLFINGQSGYAELVFETHATRATVWGRLRHRFGRRGLAALLLLVVGAHGALVVVIRSLVTAPPSLKTPVG